MRGGVAKPSPTGVRKTGAGRLGVPDVARTGVWLRATELGSATEESWQHADVAGTASRHADTGVQSEVKGWVMHPPPPVRAVQQDDAADGPAGQHDGGDQDDGSDDGDDKGSPRSASDDGEAGCFVMCGQGNAVAEGADGVGGASGSGGDKEARQVGQGDTGASGGDVDRQVADVAAIYSPRSGVAAHRWRRTVTFTTGDAALRAGVVHAVTALGQYSLMAAPRRSAAAAASSTHGRAHSCPEVFVVGRRPRRSVRLLVALARGCWVVSDTWILDSVHARAWQPCARYVPRMFSGVPAARAAAKASKSLFNGLSIGWCGTLDVPHEDFSTLVEVAGGIVTRLLAAVVVQGGAERNPAGAAGPRAVFVNQGWLPDCIANWRVLAYDAYKPE